MIIRDTCSIVARPDLGKFSIFHVIRESVVHGVSLISISIDPPSESEKTNCDIQSSEISPSREISVPLPTGIVEPENEKPRTVVSLELNVKSLEAESPPDTPVMHPL